MATRRVREAISGIHRCSFRHDPRWHPSNTAIVSEPWFQGELLKEHIHFGVLAPLHDPEDSGIVGFEGRVQDGVARGLDVYLRTIPLEDVDISWE